MGRVRDRERERESERGERPFYFYISIAPLKVVRCRAVSVFRRLQSVDVDRFK